MSESARIEQLARLIAFWHGARFIVAHPQRGTLTVAAQRGFGQWGDASTRYAEAHWREYLSAAHEALRFLSPPDYDG